MANKARKFEKEKENLIKWRNSVMKDRKKTIWIIAAFSMICLSMFGIGIYFKPPFDYVYTTIVISTILIRPFCDLSRENRVIKEIDCLIVATDKKREAWLKELEQK